MAIKKSAGGVEDLALGMTTVVQLRKGVETVITQINAGNIPYSETLSIADKLELIEDGSLFLHLQDFNNPHQVTYDQTGAAPTIHTHLIEDVIGLPEELDRIDTHEHDDRYFQKTEHISSYGTATEAGKPIVLNNAGLVDSSLVDIGTLVYIGVWTPSVGNEYPDTTGLDSGSFWVVNGLGDTVTYTFTTGDLSGQSTKDSDIMLHSVSEGWSLLAGDTNSKIFYALDGSKAITANFAGGGFKITNIADGTDATDGTTKGQVDTQFNTNIALGSYGGRRI